MPEIKSFRGLNNVHDPLNLGLEWQTIADNADVTAQLKMLRCRGYTRSTTANSTMYGSYATQDQQRLYVVDGTALSYLTTAFTAVQIATLTVSAAMYFAEVNGQVYCTNGTDYLLIRADHSVTSWGIVKPDSPTVSRGTGNLPEGTYQVVTTLVAADGRESANSHVSSIDLTAAGAIAITDIQQTAGYTTNVYVTETDGTVFRLLQAGAGVSATYNCAPEDLGPELPFYNTNEPHGIMPCVFKGRIFLAESFPALDATALWASSYLAYHQFDAGRQGGAIPGTVRLMLPCAESIIIGTEREIWSWDGDLALVKLADYGVPPGFCGAALGPSVYLWTDRGLARAMPFENLTEGTISVNPGITAAATVMQRDGHLRFIVALGKGGTAYNQY